LWQQAVHVPGIYDLEVDTSVLSPEQCADVIHQPTGCATSWKPCERRNLRMSILSFVRFLNACLSENASVAFPSSLCLFCLR
jgi:hypothetical protein